MGEQARGDSSSDSTVRLLIVEGVLCQVEGVMFSLSEDICLQGLVVVVVVWDGEGTGGRVRNAAEGAATCSSTGRLLADCSVRLCLSMDFNTMVWNVFEQW